MAPRISRVLWFVALWAAGVLTVTIIGLGIRLMLTS
jgi:hypothetical protein